VTEPDPSVAGSAEASPSNIGTASPTVAPIPSPSPEAAWIATALDFARTTGLPLAADSAPVMADAEASFARDTFHRISIPLADTKTATLDVFLDDDGSIRVVEDGTFDVYREQGEALSTKSIVRKAQDYLRLAGVDLADGTLNIASSLPGREWVLTFDRQLLGYPVANPPMAWWVDGDRAFLVLRGDGALRTLYFVRPDHQPAPETPFDRDMLIARLANVAGVTRRAIRELDPEFVWVRGRDPVTGGAATELWLGYCATDRNAHGWIAWCVDAGTGELVAQGSGAD
jgi:hypothetical protein